MTPFSKCSLLPLIFPAFVLRLPYNSSQHNTAYKWLQQMVVTPLDFMNSGHSFYYVKQI